MCSDSTRCGASCKRQPCVRADGDPSRSPSPAVSSSSPPGVVHAYTASGAVAGVYRHAAPFSCSTSATRSSRCSSATVIDATDGVLARLGAREGGAARLRRRAARRHRRLPDVRVPADAADLSRRADFRPGSGSPIVGAGAREQRVSASPRPTPRPRITSSPAFRPTGTSSCCTCTCSGLPPAVNAIVLVVLSALVFVRIGYVYPSRTPALRGLTLALGWAWALRWSLR